MKIVLLTGAGISAESGLKTFRDSEDGLWNNYSIAEVCSIKGWNIDPNKVNDFYNMRRLEVLKASPNAAHTCLAEAQDELDIHIITTNIDDLHERAGSRNVLHLHGQVLYGRPAKHGLQSLNDYLIQQHLIPIGIEGIKPFQTTKDNELVRPHVVFFGESVPNLQNAQELIQSADILIIVGTSLNVYPAANLASFTKPSCIRYRIDPIDDECSVGNSPNAIKSIKGRASVKLPELISEIKKQIKKVSQQNSEIQS